MTAPRRREAGGGAGANALGAGAAGMRGMLLIAVAVLLGAGLLAKSFGDGGPISSGGGGSTPTGAGSKTPTEQSTGSQGTATDNTTPTTPTTHQPATVNVLVLNGDGGAGLAGKGKDKLVTAGFTLATAGDANRGNTKIATSAVYFLAGFDADALAVATALSLPATVIKAIPTPLPSEMPTSGIGSANVVVVIGSDAPLVTG